MVVEPWRAWYSTQTSGYDSCDRRPNSMFFKRTLGGSGRRHSRRGHAEKCGQAGNGAVVICIAARPLGHPAPFSHMPFPGCPRNRD